MEDPEDAVEQVAVWLPRVSLAAMVCEIGQEVFEPLPLAVAEFILQRRPLWPSTRNAIPVQEQSLVILTDGLCGTAHGRAATLGS
jgi:hypothetical protein